MTALLPELDRGPLYPVTPGFPRCVTCYQRTPGLSTCSDPRDGQLRLLCFDCYSNLHNGRPVQLPTGETLADTWEWLARSYINHRHEHGDQELGVTEAVIDQALTDLAPRLDLTTGWAAFEQYYNALLDLQDIRDDNAGEVGEWRDFVEGEADRDRENALTKLTGSHA